jgi:poly(3-hydroxyalkanoate) synthetase
VEKAPSRRAAKQRTNGRATMPAARIDRDHPQVPNPFLWPLVAAATASDAAARYFGDLARALTDTDATPPKPEPAWATPNATALDLTTVRLRDFSSQSVGPATLICAPLALHGATIADFAPRHSLVQALCAADLERVFVTDWRSATDEMRFLSIDNYLADLNVVIETLGPPIDLIGLCQGGWMALLYAARFPHKVRRLVLAGAPVDVRAGASAVSELANNMPLSTFTEIVQLGAGRLIGSRVLQAWGAALAGEESLQVLQLPADLGVAESHALERSFRDWYDWTVDLPGTYYLQIVSWLYKENRLADGRFVALGRLIDLADVDIPIFLLAARDDTLVAPAQLLATAKLVGTPRHAIETLVEPCGHLSLFMGRKTLQHAWDAAARWLLRELSPA